MDKVLITIWHNPNCSKSKEAYHILEINSESIQSFDYLNETITKEQILDLMKKLAIDDIREMLRAKEIEYKKHDIDNRSQDEIIDIVLKNHKLIERPIIIKKDKAVIARPMEKLIKLLEK